MRSTLRARSRLVLLLAYALMLLKEVVNAEEEEDPFLLAGGNFTAGHPSCPCLSQEETEAINWVDMTDSSIDYFGEQTDISTYGLGCNTHDMAIPGCSSPECAGNENLIPKSRGCQSDFCELNFCYVDPDNCDLMFQRSRLFPKSFRFYSYATCWDVDAFTADSRIQSLEGRIFKVGLNSNSGGWQGAYSSNREQFKGPFDLWSGPAVDFAIEGAKQGGYQMKLTQPPAYLRNNSQRYFESSSSFDFCVYATSLGFLDFCLAQYTITDKRATTTDWLVLGSQDLNLIVQYQEEDGGWESFLNSLSTIFSPFTPSVWIFLVFFVVPVLGALMIVHEYNHPGSSYQKTEDVLVKSNTGSRIERVETRKIPLLRHTMKAVYVNLLSLLQQAYVHKAVTNGAMLNLLGISFFILTIIAVYTANLAAILTKASQRTTIAGLSDALKANYRICSERKNMETIRALVPEIEDRHMVLDPIDIGGDGQPGFNCPDCGARLRVFDFLDVKKADSDPRYCHAAFAPIEDLEVEQRKGRHCDKTSIGSRVGASQTGIPVNENVSPELIAQFLTLKNDGVFDRQLIIRQPIADCKVFDEGGEEGVALNITQLTGIWIVSFGFATVGLLVTWLQPKVEKRRKETVKSVHQYDQTGHRINVLEKDDQWIDQKSIVKGTKRIYIGESRWSQAANKFGGSVASFDAMSKRGPSRQLSINAADLEPEGRSRDGRGSSKSFDRSMESFRESSEEGDIGPGEPTPQRYASITGRTDPLFENGHRSDSSESDGDEYVVNLKTR